jgi:hypothetical protein
MDNMINFSTENRNPYKPMDDFYSADESGKIRNRFGEKEGSGGWVIDSIGILSTNGKIKELIKWSDFYKTVSGKPDNELYFSNGRPKTILIDIDHGTRRRWGTRVEF